MMNPEVKKKWLAALRSGKFQQAYGKLHDRKGYCCIGVLCEIVKPGNFITKYSTILRKDVFEFDGELYGMPKSIYDDIGYTEDDSHNYGILISMNDRGSSDFNKIADKLEELL